MAKPRKKASGKWEIALRHPSLPNGRKYFTFDTEADAIAYAQQWKLMKDSGLPPPRELLDADNGYGNIRLCRVLGEWEDSGYAAPTQILTISTVNREGGWHGQACRSRVQVAAGLHSMTQGGKAAHTPIHSPSNSVLGACHR